MRLSVFTLLILLICITPCSVIAQTSPSTPSTSSSTSQKKPVAQPRVKPNNGPLKKNGTVNMDYKVRKDAPKRISKPQPADKKPQDK